MKHSEQMLAGLNELQLSHVVVLLFRYVCACFCKTYFNVPTSGEGGENEQKSHTQNHNVESPSVCHGVSSQAS